jgi:hypothetical protein
VIIPQSGHHITGSSALNLCSIHHVRGDIAQVHPTSNKTTSKKEMLYLSSRS